MEIRTNRSGQLFNGISLRIEDMAGSFVFRQLDDRYTKIYV